jgi:hypothetical protein
LLLPVNPKPDADHIFIGAGIWLDDDESRAGLLLMEARRFVEEECPNTEAQLKAQFNGFSGLRAYLTESEAVAHAHPRPAYFKEDTIQAFYDGIKHKPETTFGNVKADVLADKDPHFHRGNFCSVIRGSAWRGVTTRYCCSFRRTRRAGVG